MSCFAYFKKPLKIRIVKKENVILKSNSQGHFERACTVLSFNLSYGIAVIISKDMFILIS
jgi:hypothetical protein